MEAFPTQNQESWIEAHINAFNHFGGITKVIIPDNLKTGVNRTSWYSPTINKTYHEMAEHYGVAIVPARVRKPKDKPAVEGTVGVISTWIIAALRNQKFFSFSNLNTAIKEKLRALNERPFQKKSGSRQSTFMCEEKDFLLPLPAKPYELALWKKESVPSNYHITVERMHYSIPYEYIQQQVDIRMTLRVIEVFFNQMRIATHPRLYGNEGQYSTNPDHMPEKHKQYMLWDSPRFIAWAESIGPNTLIAIKSILSAHKVEQQGFRACMGLMKLADKYSALRIESACCRALSYTPNPSYLNITTILKSGQDKLKTADPPQKSSDESHGFTRGAEYYGRK